ncbi:hypothetical protein APED_19935 [Acanthopleuribacter pedis]
MRLLRGDIFLIEEVFLEEVPRGDFVYLLRRDLPSVLEIDNRVSEVELSLLFYHVKRNKHLKLYEKSQRESYKLIRALFKLLPPSDRENISFCTCFDVQKYGSYKISSISDGSSRSKKSGFEVVNDLDTQWQGRKYAVERWRFLKKISVWFEHVKDNTVPALYGVEVISEHANDVELAITLCEKLQHSVCELTLGDLERVTNPINKRINSLGEQYETCLMEWLRRLIKNADNEVGLRIQIDMKGFLSTVKRRYEALGFEAKAAFLEVAVSERKIKSDGVYWAVLVLVAIDKVKCIMPDLEKNTLFKNEDELIYALVRISTGNSPVYESVFDFWLNASLVDSNARVDVWFGIARKMYDTSKELGNSYVDLLVHFGPVKVRYAKKWYKIIVEMLFEKNMGHISLPLRASLKGQVVFDLPPEKQKKLVYEANKGAVPMPSTFWPKKRGNIRFSFFKSFLKKQIRHFQLAERELTENEKKFLVDTLKYYETVLLVHAKELKDSYFVSLVYCLVETVIKVSRNEMEEKGVAFSFGYDLKGLKERLENCM